MKKIYFILSLLLIFIACEDEITYPENHYFNLSATQVDFDNEIGEYVIEVNNYNGAITAELLTEADWCNIVTSGNKITISVEENILVSSRIAKIGVSSNNDYSEIMVRQGQKYFEYIPTVKNLNAIAEPGQITLKWSLPEEDNFSHVILQYIKNDRTITVKLPAGTTEYTVQELREADGEYVFYLQSYDKENDPGLTAKASAKAKKLVAIRFEDEIETQWVPYYLRESDTQATKLKIGSLEYDEGNQISVALEVDETLLNKYNTTNNTNYIMLPTEAYNVPDNFIYKSEDFFQDMILDINISILQDRTIYALPINIKSVEGAEISEIMSSTVVVYYVEDLQGWYTTDRMPLSGESASVYSADPQKRRRYINRINEYVWHTGYKFNQYADSETQNTGTYNNKQIITINPDTKKITVSQGDYATLDQNSYYDFETNTFFIQYLYRDWANWWSDEKMHTRSLKKALD